MKIETLKEKNFGNELLPQVIDRMFAVCREDKSFKSKTKLDAVEDVSKKLDDKISKQHLLLKRGDEMLIDVNSRLESLDESNEKMRTDLLSILGGEV